MQMRIRPLSAVCGLVSGVCAVEARHVLVAARSAFQVPYKSVTFYMAMAMPGPWLGHAVVVIWRKNPNEQRAISESSPDMQINRNMHW